MPTPTPVALDAYFSAAAYYANGWIPKYSLGGFGWAQPGIPLTGATNGLVAFGYQNNTNVVVAFEGPGRGFRCDPGAIRDRFGHLTRRLRLTRHGDHR